MSKKIMVVDDSRIAQMQLQKELPESGYEIVACCQTGEQAVDMYESVRPDLVTMDIILPGMDGLEAARSILSAHPDARILMVSSLAYDDTFCEAEKIGAKGFVYKPFNRADLQEAFDQAFKS